MGELARRGCDRGVLHRDEVVEPALEEKEEVRRTGMVRAAGGQRRASSVWQEVLALR